MKTFTVVVMMVFMAAGCGEQNEIETPEVVPDQVSEAERFEAARSSLLAGQKISPNDLRDIGIDFGKKLAVLKLTEAKECRVGLYIQSEHFRSGNPTGFNVDFSQADRDRGEADLLSFAYYGFNHAVRQLEVEKIKSDMSDAPASIRNQAVGKGDFYTSVVALSRCKFEDMAAIDSQLPYYKIFCVAAGASKRERQNQQQAKMNTICDDLSLEYLKTGYVDMSLLETSPLR